MNNKEDILISNALNTNFLSNSLENVDFHISRSSYVHTLSQDIQVSLQKGGQDLLLASFALFIHKITQEEYVDVILGAKTHTTIALTQDVAEKEAYFTYLSNVPFTTDTTNMYAPSFSTEDAYSVFDISPTKDLDKVVFTYNAVAFYPEDVEIYARMYEHILEQLIHTTYVTDITLASKQDKQVYAQLNDTAKDFGNVKDLVELFKSTTHKHAGNIMLQNSDVKLTYKQVDLMSDKVAITLLNAGVSTGDFVPVYMDRSVDMVVCLLGVMKAGGVYTPVDPSYPADRVLHIFQDTKANVVVSNNKNIESLKNMQNVPTLVNLNKDCANSVVDTSMLDSVEKDLAYAIYTSGSTGKPKGTLLEHQGAVNLALGMTELFNLKDTSVVGQFVSFSFDPSIADLFTTIKAGASLYFFGSDERISVFSFAEAIKKRHISHLVSLPAAFFNELAAQNLLAYSEYLESLKYIGIGGESLPPSSVTSFQEVFGTEITLLNLYGPTECTVTSTTHTIDYRLQDNVNSIPIGVPLPNYETIVVDAWGALCPVGRSGELLISSPGLAKEYLNDSTKTSSSFVSSTDISGMPKRFYRTGDLVRVTMAGNIEHLGRKDWQIKIRGHRIETGEIENVLLQHESLGQVYVMPRGTENDKYLVSFCTLKEGYIEDTESLLNHLRSKLPSYMIPSHIVFLDDMPLSPTGKIDRKQLDKLDILPKSVNRDILIARTDIEKDIETSWRSVLGVENIDVHDDFFGVLKGHSFKVIESVSQLRDKYPFIKIQDFFKYPTIAGLASHISVELKKTGHVSREKLSFLESHILLNEYPQTLGKIHRSTQTQGNILLTGATGFLGSHLLKEIIDTTDAHVICVVRNKNIKRLEKVLTRFFGTDIIKQMHRISVVSGDLSQPSMGLSDNDLDYIISRVDSIIHCAANVNHFGHAQDFKSVNVESTRFLLKLAEKKQARFHYISTMSVVEDLTLAGYAFESTQKISHWDLPLDSVYTASKLEAEKLVEDFASRGVEASIYRMGNLVGNSKTGLFQQNIDNNAFYRMIKSAVLLKVAPKAKWYVDLTPIDFASRAVVKLALSTKTSHRVFHICNPTSIAYSDFLEKVRKVGYAVSELDEKEYQKFATNISNHGSEEGLRLATTQLEGSGVVDSPIEFACPQTSYFLQGTGVKCPPPSDSLIEVLLRHATFVGFLPEIATAK